MNITKITVTYEDGSTADFVSPAPVTVPTQTVALSAGQVLEVTVA